MTKKQTLTQKIFSTNCPYANHSQTNAKRLLFVCSVGMLRSPTAQMVATGLGHNARACGSCLDLALIPLSCNLINWADHIFFMNRENQQEALKHFTPVGYDDDILAKGVVWNIPDQYNWGDNVLWNIFDQLLRAADL